MVIRGACMAMMLIALLAMDNVAVAQPVAGAWWCRYSGAFYPQVTGCPYGGWQWVPAAPTQSNKPEPPNAADGDQPAGGALDSWCATVTTPRSIALCSDAELRRLAIERQGVFNAARSRVAKEQRPALIDDQKKWVESYAVLCGLDADKPPNLPLPAKLRDCMAAAGRARILYIQDYPASAERAARDKEAAAAQAARDEVATEERKKRDAAEMAERLRLTEERSRELAEERARELAVAEEKAKTEREKREKYKSVDGKIFLVDGNEFASSEAKVKIKGTFTTTFGNHYLIVGGTFIDPVKIGLLTDGAARAARLKFIECQSRTIYYSMTGCSGTVIFGTATFCEHRTLLNAAKEPCIEVDDAEIPER